MILKIMLTFMSYDNESLVEWLEGYWSSRCQLVYLFLFQNKIINSHLSHVIHLKNTFLNETFELMLNFQKNKKMKWKMNGNILFFGNNVLIFYF